MNNNMSGNDKEIANIDKRIRDLTLKLKERTEQCHDLRRAIKLLNVQRNVLVCGRGEE